MQQPRREPVADGSELRRGRDAPGYGAAGAAVTGQAGIDGEGQAGRVARAGDRDGVARAAPVPPAPVQSFVHAKDALPVLTKTGRARAPCETIPPLADGNGRMAPELTTRISERDRYGSAS